MSNWTRGDLNIWRPRVETHAWDVKKGDAGLALVQKPTAPSSTAVEAPVNATLYDPRYFV